MNIYTVLPLGLNNYLSWTPGPFSLTAVLCPDFLTPCAISGLGRNTVPDDIKSGSPCRAKEPEDVTWKCTKTSNIRKYEKRARLTDKLPLPPPFCRLLQGVVPPPSLGPPPGKLPLCRLFGGIRWPSRRHLPTEKQCLSQIAVGLWPAGVCLKLQHNWAHLISPFFLNTAPESYLQNTISIIITYLPHFFWGT